MIKDWKKYSTRVKLYQLAAKFLIALYLFYCAYLNMSDSTQHSIALSKRYRSIYRDMRNQKLRDMLPSPFEVSTNAESMILSLTALELTTATVLILDFPYLGLIYTIHCLLMFLVPYNPLFPIDGKATGPLGYCIKEIALLGSIAMLNFPHSSKKLKVRRSN